MNATFSARVTVTTETELRSLRPGQYFRMDGVNGRYMGSTPRVDLVLWRKTGSPKFANKLRTLVKGR